MGHEIVYCVGCATRIAGADFERGRAVRVGGRAVCAACMPKVAGNLPPEPPKELVRRSSTRIKAQKAGPTPGTSARLPALNPAPPRKSNAPLVAGIAVAAVVVIGGLLSLMLRTPPAEPPLSSERVIAKAPPAPPPQEKREDLQLRLARLAIEAARAKMASAPGDLDGQLALWEEAARKAALTPLFKDASDGLQEVKQKRRPEPPRERAAEPPLVPPPPPSEAKASSADAKAYQARWESAMAKASARDFDGAVAELGRAAAELADETVKQDARADGEILRGARAMMAEAQSALGRLPRGQAVALTWRSPSGERKRIEGAVARPGPARIEVQQKDGSVFIEAEDVAVDSLAELLGRREGPDARALAVLCLLEGDREAAAARVATEALAARYWDYARDAAAKVPKTPPRELEARTRFYEAEREFAKMETLPSAVSKYKSLAEDYADARVVKDELSRIRRRSEAGREYLFLGTMLKGTGTFGLAPAPRVDTAWVSKADVEGAQAVENYVEAEFGALPGTAYRCWALVGGCCQETFSFYLQTTEALDVHPQTKQKAPIDPGAGIASLIKPTIPGLKKTHEEHKIKGSKTHPKTAARWEWVSIPLAKYSAPGAKKIRLISDRQGFAVGAVLVSSTRTAAIPDPEFKEELARLHSQMVEWAPAPPPAEKPWRPLFDGKSLDFLREGAPGWRLESGAIAHGGGAGNAAQTREEFEDIEIRIRFEVKDLDTAYFKLRQGAGGGYAVSITGGAVKGLEGKPHELVFMAKGEQVTAMLDGKPVSTSVEGAAKRGCLQFNANGKTLNILAIDAR